MWKRVRRNRFAELVGPFYTSSSVATWVGVRELDVLEMVFDRQFLGCITTDQQVVLPVSQFRLDGTAHIGLPKVLDILASGTTDAWTWAAWLHSRVPGQLEGVSGMQWLAAQRDLDTLLRLAQMDAASWAT